MHSRAILIQSRTPTMPRHALLPPEKPRPPAHDPKSKHFSKTGKTNKVKYQIYDFLGRALLHCAEQENWEAVRIFERLRKDLLDAKKKKTNRF